MSKQDVVDYVMETPHNTNRTVLEGLVDTAVKEGQVQADWDQNDETAKDYVKNRIGYNNISFLGSVIFTADSTSSLTYTATEKDLTLYNAILDAKPDGAYFPGYTVQVNGIEYMVYHIGDFYDYTIYLRDAVQEAMYKFTATFNIPTSSASTLWKIETPKSTRFTVDSEYEVKFYSNKAVRIPGNLISPEIFRNPDFPIYAYSGDKDFYGSAISFFHSVATGFNAVSFNGNASKSYSFSHGHYKNNASGISSHAEGGPGSSWGEGTTASGQASHAEGSGTVAEGTSSHAEGYSTTAKGKNSHAEGFGTIASGENSHTEGKYNIEDSKNLYANIIGNGQSNKRSNAHTLDWQGNAWYSGDVYVGSTSGTDKDEGSKKLATEEYVDNHRITIDTTLSSTSENPVQNKVVKKYVDDSIKAIPVDGTTIKFNDQGQLTLALSNANGVSF